MGAAARNTILLLDHYLHLMREEGCDFAIQTLVRAGRERVIPVLMTALTTGIGLMPLVLFPGEPGRDLLYSVASVIVGGLVTSTLLDLPAARPPIVHGRTSLRADGEGPLIYKLVTGDFEVSAIVRTYDPNDPSQPPGLSYNLGGITLRDPASSPGQRDWLHVTVGSGTAQTPIAVEDSRRRTRRVRCSSTR